MSRRYRKIKEDMPLSAVKIEDDTLASRGSVSRLMSSISFYLHLSPSISFSLNLPLSTRKVELAKLIFYYIMTEKNRMQTDVNDEERLRLKQTQLDKRYLRMAEIWAENSYCTRRKVGCLVVKEKRIISDGYNGTPSGFENVCEDENNLTKPYVLHAEANAITKLARSHNNSDGATIYVTDSPCIECAKLIIQAGIKRLVYSRHYRLTDGIELLERAGIEIVYIEQSGESV